MGGLDSATNVLLVVACGCCLDVLSVTSADQPQLHSGVYWYNTPGLSIGFSPNSTIQQTNADTFDLANNQRVSWFLDFNSPLVHGGWRLGSLINLYSNTQFYKIYLKSP